MRWITDRIGTAAFGDPAIPDSAELLDVRHLVDKAGNGREAVLAMIDTGARAIADGHSLVVCCDYGMSRSNAIAAGVLHRVTALSPSDAIRFVLDKTGETAIKADLVDAVLAALESRSAGPTNERRILVTGGSGALGSAFVRQTRHGTTIIAPSRAELDMDEGAGALSLFVREHDVNTIVHFANPKVYVTNKAVGASLTTLRNVLDVCASIGTRLVYPSGWEVFSGYRTHGLMAGVGLPVWPRGPYGEAKALAEQMITWFVSQSGVEATVLRISPVYGLSLDRPKFINNFIDKAMNDQLITTHLYENGEPKLALLHVDDAIAGIQAAVESRTSGVVHFGGESLVSTAEIAQFIVSQLGSQSRIESADIAGHWANVRLDNEQTTARLAWRPTIDWKSGVSELIRSRHEHSES